MVFQMKNVRIFALSLMITSALLLMPSCASTPNTGNEGTNALSADLLKGKEMYRKKCIECHGLYAPSRYTDSQWHSLMEDMADEANLNAQQEELILNYLLAVN